MPLADQQDPRRLLALATRRAQGAPGAGSPRQVDLRRAVSTAYYAAYHAVTLRAARQVCGYPPEDSARPPDAALHAVRWFSHEGVTRAAELVRLGGAAIPDNRWAHGKRAAWEILHDRSPGEEPVALSAQLVDIAGQLISLKGQRHSADYARVGSISRQEALDSVEDARSVVTTVDRCAGLWEFQGFFALVALANKSLPPGVG